MKPARIRSAVYRRWFERRLRRVRVATYGPLTQVGTAHGGWIVPAGAINGAWTCYCVSAGSDVSFDLELIRRYGATVRSVEPLNALRWQAEPEAAADPRLTVLDAAVAPQDGVGTTRARTLHSLMSELGDQQVQLLKLDVGGDEYGVLDKLDLRSLGIRVLCVKLHATRPVHEAVETIERIRSQGYQPVHCKRRTSFTFVGHPLLTKHSR